MIAGGIKWAFEKVQPAIKLQQELVAKIGVPKTEYELVLPDEAIQAEADKWLEGKLGAALRQPYPERNELISDLRAAYHLELADSKENYEELKADYDEAFTVAVHKDVRAGITKESIRPDGRKLDEVRPLSS